MAMLAMTFSFFLVEIVFGYISHSVALVADSFHMLSDVLALMIAFACMKAEPLTHLHLLNIYPTNFLFAGGSAEHTQEHVRLGEGGGAGCVD